MTYNTTIQVFGVYFLIDCYFFLFVLQDFPAHIVHLELIFDKLKLIYLSVPVPEMQAKKLIANRSICNLQV